MICATFVAFGFKAPSNSEAGKMIDFTVNYSFKGIVEGYDHDNKTELYVDGNLVATSTIAKESQPNFVTAKVKKGKHSIQVINYAMYEGTWEKHTIENNYSIDCTYEATLDINKKAKTLTLLFDIDDKTQVVE